MKIEGMITDHLVNLAHQIKQQLEVWNGLPLTWFERVSFSKRNRLPKLIFIFLNLTLTIPK